MQCARLPVGVRPIPIVKAECAVGIFLNFQGDVVGAERMDSAFAHKHKVAHVRVAEFEKFFDIFCGYGLFYVIRLDTRL